MDPDLRRHCKHDHDRRPCRTTRPTPATTRRARPTTTSARTSRRWCGIWKAPGPWTLLDFGCGPGRDLAALAAAGRHGRRSRRLGRVRARWRTWRERLRGPASGLPRARPARRGRFDGIFANASMQHVPGERAAAGAGVNCTPTLKPRGVLLASIPRGDNEEGWNGARYSALPRSVDVARLSRRRRLHRTRALLPAGRQAERGAALATERVSRLPSVVAESTTLGSRVRGNDRGPEFVVSAHAGIQRRAAALRGSRGGCFAETHSPSTTVDRIAIRITLTCGHASVFSDASSCRPMPPAPTRPSTVDSRMLMSQRNTLMPANAGSTCGTMP